MNTIGGSALRDGFGPDAAPAVGAVAIADTGAQLRRLRWAVRATLTLGVAASVAANVLHARPNPISQIIAAWPPLALLLTVELISRVPHHRRSLGVIRIAATAVIAAIATWVSYWHLVGVAARYGETEAGAAYLLPISVDGLVIVASVSLVELTGRIRATDTQQRPASRAETTSHATAPAGRSVQQPAASAGAVMAKPRQVDPEDTSAGRSRQKAASRRAPDHERAAPGRRIEVPSNRSRDQLSDEPPDNPATRRGPTRDTPGTLSEEPDAADDGIGGEVAVPLGTAAAVAYWHRLDPGLHPAEIATKIGRSERTVRRYWPQHPTTSRKVGGQGDTHEGHSQAHDGSGQETHVSI